MLSTKKKPSNMNSACIVVKCVTPYISIYNFKSSCYLFIKNSLAFYNVTLIHHKSKANIFVDLQVSNQKNKKLHPL